MARKAKKDSASVMLAPNAMIPFDDERIKYPMYASYKFDGNRCFVRGGGMKCDLLTRHMLTQPNRNLPEFMEPLMEIAKKGWCFDCELLIPDATHHGVHGSILNSHDKAIPDNMQVHVFDVLSSEEWKRGDTEDTFTERQDRYSMLLRNHLSGKEKERFLPVEQRRVCSAAEAAEDFKTAIELGYEGIMLRSPDGGYKQGRCGHKGAWLLKFKAVETHDAQVVEVLQQMEMRKGIKRERSASGHLVQPTKNSDNYTMAESCSGFRVRMEDGTEGEVTFSEGVANMDDRKAFWKARKRLVGRWLEYKAYPGAKDSIRSGRMIRWRDDKATK